MIKSYFKIFFRNLIHHKSYTFINSLGLTIGIATNIFIFLWIADELQFDKFHEKSDRIFSVIINNTYPDGRIETYPATPAKLKSAIESEIPGAEIVSQYSYETEFLVKNEVTSVFETGLYADASLFDIFSFPVISGNISDDIKSISISQELAEKLFNRENPIGKTLSVGSSYELMVTGVFENIPANSSLQFDFVIPFELYVKDNPWTQNWQSGGTRTVVLMNSDEVTANEQLADLIKKNCAECTTTPFLFPFAKHRLYSQFENGQNVGGRIQQVYLFGSVALLILVMASINFINLTTARATSRSREVGIRKSIGARKKELVLQFITETLILSIIALLFALLIVELMLPFLNSLTGKSMEIDMTSPLLISGILIITVVCGLLAGLYPAFVLSSFNPANALKGENKSSLTGSKLRKTLVAIQFTTSVVLVVGSIVIYKQINYISTINLGFNKENVIVLDQNEGMLRNYPAIRNDLQQLPFVDNIAFGGNNIFTIPITTTDPVWVGKPENSSLRFKVYRCDAEFIPTLDIKIENGRNFIDKRDAANYIINKKAAEVMGIPANEVVGSSLEMWNGKGEIIGVTENFHNDNLKFGIEPMIFMYSESVGSHYFIRISGQSTSSEQIAQVKNVFMKHNPDYPFEYTYLDDVFDREYQSETVIGKLSLSFTVIAILISFLGLYGLASFTAERRTKEMGIRKIMGASVTSIMLLLFVDFAILVLIGLLIGYPIAWWLTDEFLANYQYHTNIGFTLYFVTGLVMLIITALSVGFQSFKAATTNPVNTLSSER